MKLETKITERDKKLLVFLAVFLLIVGFAMLLILPVSDTISALKEEIAASVQSKKEMDNKIAALLSLQQQKEEVKEEWEHVSRGLYPRMENQEIDKIVTDEVLKQGLTTKSLKINTNQESLSLKKYLAAEEETEEETNQKEESDAPETVSSGIYTASVSLSVEGNRENIRSLTDRFADDYLAVRIVSMKYDTREVINEEGLVQSLNTILDMELEFYMCEK